jgi:AbrB family looped-hinge helix DNA binding protein
MKSSNSAKHDPTILGIVTVNEKGQVVIPSEARAAIELQTGDKLLVMLHKSHDGIFLVKPDGLEQYAKQMLEKLSNAKDSFKQTNNTNE